ncbi:toxin [Neobacillus sp. OS1-33]|uniref:anthrax toxin lethal factor-related metalloendopeptidase n=1 Tax=Neobacillus sp. OS1-33 TaxID=3070683 RepID=UPI0027E09030|nr:toxin [Neobacillus sp. OS1-33]WML25886.1 toxin [Neobacillus sp. OS1-33]
MRKSFIVIIFAGLFLSSITTSQASNAEILLGDYSKNSILYQSLQVEHSFPLLEQIIVLPRQFFDEHEAAVMISRINSLPYSLLEKINNQGINLKLFTGKLTDNPTARKYAGQVPRGYTSNVTWDDIPGMGGSKVVLVKIGASEKGVGHGSVNLELHEMAHSIDRYVYDEISGSKDFLRAWKKEHEQLFPGNSYFLFPEEYFAESFAMYYLNNGTKEILRKKAPETFDLIKQLH